MSDPINLVTNQMPARTNPVGPFEGMSSRALEALDDMTRGVNRTLDNLSESNKKSQQVAPDESRAKSPFELALEAQVDRTVKSLHAIGEVSDQLARFSVAMGIAQSFGRNMQSFLRGQ